MRIRYALALCTLSAPALVPLIGCDDFGLVGEVGGEGAPTAVLRVDFDAGQAPFTITLDASDSAPHRGGDALQFEFDTDGDGDFEVDPQSSPTLEVTYDDAGRFAAAVRVRGPDGRFDIDSVTIEVTPENPPRTADIDVDSNKNGVIDGADDVVEEDSAAPFLANVDDDNGDGQRDRQDRSLNSDDDDMADIIVRRVKDADGARLFLSVSPQVANERTRVWRGDEVLTEAGTNRAEVGDGAADVDLRLEAMTGRTGDWDGVVQLKLTLEKDGAVISEDVVVMRAAPVLFPDNLAAPRRLFVMDVPFGPDNNRELMVALQSLPDGVELYTTDADDYFYDRWMQDNWEVGYQSVPTKDGVKEMITALQVERSYGGQGLDAFVPGEWIGPGRGFFYPGGPETSHNYGGNLEVSPPTTQDPFGRMLFGGGTQTLSGARNENTMNDEQVSFLNAQELQAPAIELSSEWLAVGHIDEIFQFVPDLSPDGGSNFKVIIASPQMARDVLLAMRADGKGSSLVFAGRRDSYSVDEILDAEQFSALNEAAQIRIDEVQEVLTRALGLSDDDFLPVPVLFNEIDSGLVAAFNPGIQNLVTVGDRLFVPDPEGPRDGGVDVWQEATRASLATTDLDVIFVDVFESYHELLGEAHCGTNLERAPHATAWWTVE
jgi:protein-arginine deiminase